MRAVTVTTLRSKLKHYFDLVTNSKDVLIIPRNNKDSDAVVIMSIQEYNSLKETEYLLSTKANRRRLEESIRQMEEGEAVSFDLKD